MVKATHLDGVFQTTFYIDDILAYLGIGRLEPMVLLVLRVSQDV